MPTRRGRRTSTKKTNIAENLYWLRAGDKLEKLIKSVSNQKRGGRRMR